MMGTGPFQSLRDLARGRWSAGRKARLARPKPRERLDLALAALLLGLGAGGGALGALWSAWEASHGLFDPPAFQPIQDRRILSDFRSNPAPFKDSVVLGSRLVAARQDGALVGYDPATEIMTEGRFSAGPDMVGALAGLSAGCASQENCPDAGALFAVTEGGGLARGDAGLSTWSIVLSDRPWTGQDGQPVAQEDVALWAVEDRGTWVLAWAGPAKGLGLFGQRGGTWVSLPAAEISALIPGPGLFWLGNGTGVLRLTPGDTAPSPVEGAVGEVLSLERQGQGALALVRGKCTDKGQGCLSLLKIGAEGPAQRVWGEESSFPALSDQGLVHAALQGRWLVVLGEKGVYRYDLQTRSWSQLAPQAPDAFAAVEEGQEIVLSIGLQSYRLSGGELTPGAKLTERLAQILPLGSGQVLGLDRQGQTVELSADATARPVFAADPGLPKGARLTKGASGKGIVVLWGPEGLLLHDPKSRRYAFQTWDDLQMSPDDIEILGDATSLWLVQPRAGLVFAAEIKGDWPGKRLDLGAPPKPVALGGTPRVMEVSGGTLVVTMADGSSETIAPGGLVARIPGAPLDGAFTPQIAMPYRTGLLFTDGPRVRAYDHDDRGWSAVPDLPEPQATGLGLSGGRLYASTPSGRLFSIGKDDTGWSVSMGAGNGAAVGLDELTDARGGPMAYFAGNGRVAGYDPSAHGFTAQWGGGRGSVAIIGLQASAPIWLSDEKLFSGTVPLAPLGHRVLSAAMAGPTAVFLAETERGRYLALAGTKGDPASCLFNGGPAPAGELRDAVALPDGRVMAFTDQAIGLHDDATRRWIGVEGRPLEPGEDLALISGEVLRGDGRSLLHLPLAGIDNPDSCDPAALSVFWEAPASRSAIIDRVGDRALILGTDGEAGYWPDTKGGKVLPASSTGPALSAMVQVDGVSGGLEFLGTGGLFRYDLARRTWTKRSIEGLPAAVEAIDRASVPTAAGASEELTFRLEDGSTWGADLSDLKPTRLELPDWPHVGIAPDDLLDLAHPEGKSLILALGQDGIELHRNGKVRTLALAPRSANWSLAEVSGANRISAVLGDPARPERLAILDRDLEAAPFTYDLGTDRTWALDDKVTLWRIDRDLVLWACKVAPGATAPQNCDRMAEPPLPVTSAEMSDAAAQGKDWILALEDGRLLRLGPDMRPLATLGGPAMAPGGRLVTMGGQLYAWEGPGRALWQMSGDTPRRLVDSVLAVMSEGPRLFVETRDGLAKMREGAAVPVTATLDGVAIEGASLGNGIVYGVTAEGRIVSEAGKAAGVGLPPIRGRVMAVVPGRVESQGRETGWWIQRKDGIALSWISTCPLTQPLRAAPGSEGFEARAWPQPMPGQARCIRSRDIDAIPDSSRLQQVSVEGSALLVTTTTGRWEVAADGALTSRPGPLPAPSEALSRLRGFLADVDGQSYLNPPTISAGHVLVVRGMAEAVSTKGGQVLVPPNVFDMGGISWDRAQRQVILGQGAAALRLSPAEALSGGIFLPAKPGQAAYLGQRRFALANEGGIWQIDDGGLQAGKVIALPPIIGLSRGVFLTSPNQGYQAQDGQPVPVQDPPDLTIGKLTLSQTTWPRRVAARLEVDGQALDAAAVQGFAFDDRLAFVQVAGVPAVATPLGLVSARDFSATWPLPEGVQQFGLEGPELRAEVAGGAWLALSGGAWVASETPERTATLAEDAFRTWRRVDGRAEVVPRDPARSWAVGSGLDFPTDAVRALGGSGQGLVILTALGTETGRTLADFAPTRGAVAPDPGGAALLSQEVAPGQGVVAAETASGWQVWDAPALSWRVPAGPTETPWLARLALDMQGMRIGFDQATPWARVAVTEPDGAPGERPFTWGQGENLPFDQVTSLHSEADVVLVGTGFGLRRLQGGTIGDIQAADAGSGPAAPILALGRPVTRPTTIQVSAGAAGCLELSDPLAAPAPCAFPEPLDRRLVLDDGFWRWIEGAEGVKGAYLLSGGGLLPIGSTLPGRFPHDLLRDRSLCGGLDAELWQDGSAVTVSGTGGRRIEALTGAQDLWCQRGEALLDGGARLPPGLYVTSGGQASEITALGLSAVPFGAAISERVSGALPWEEGRLRLAVWDGAVDVEAYRQAGNWQGIGWSEGRMALDRVLGLMRQGDQVLTLTPAGATPVALSGPILGLDDLRLATTADPAVLAGCAPSRVESRDGLEQAIPADPKAPLAIGCADGQALAGAWSPVMDLGAFAPADDLFPTRTLIDAGPWKVTRADAKALAFAFRGEEFQLSGGRFSFDALSQVVPGFGPDLQAIASDGWWTWTAGGITSDDLARPGVKVDPKAVSLLWPDRVEGAEALCFHEGEGGAVALEASGRLRNRETCRRAVGQDALWSWWQDEGGPMAVAKASNGPEVQRKLEAGRFADLWATGAARLAPEGEVVVPTKVGGLVLRDSVPSALYVSSGPTALWADGQGALSFVGAAERIALAPDLPDLCPGLTDYLASLGPEPGLMRIDRAAPDAALVWSGKAEVLQALVTCDGKGDHADWMILQDVTGRARFQAGAPTGGDWLVVKAAPEGMKAALTKGGATELTLAVAGPLRAMLPAPDGRAVLLVSGGDLYRLDVDPVLSRIASEPEPATAPAQAAPVPPPTPTAPPPSPQPAAPTPQVQAPPVQSPPVPSDPLVLSPAEIEQVQIALRALGYSVGAADGILGPRTEKAIEAWKADRGLPPPGPGLTAPELQQLFAETRP